EATAGGAGQTVRVGAGILSSWSAGKPGIYIQHPLVPMDIKTVEGDLQCRELRFAILAARFNEFVVEQPVPGAVDALRRHGASEKHLAVVRAPGAFDLPVVARKVALSGRDDAIVALGAVIKGATAQFDYVAGE